MKLNIASHQIANLPLGVAGKLGNLENFEPRMIARSADRKVGGDRMTTRLPMVDHRLEQAVWLALSVASLAGLALSFSLRG